MGFVETVFSYRKLILLLFSIQCIPFTLAFYNTGHQIGDLYRNDITFTLDVAEWTSSPINTGVNLWSQCGTTYLLSGYNIMAGSDQRGFFYQRIYNHLQPHTMVYYSFSFWAIDTWNAGGDYFSIMFDTLTYQLWNTLNYVIFPSDLCGTTSSHDLSDIRVFGRVPHQSLSLTFKFILYLDQISTNEALGVRDIILTFATNPITTVAGVCGRAPITITGGMECTCVEGQFYDTSISACKLCDPSCASCFGGGSDSCYACKVGWSWDGQNCFQCHSSCYACSGPSSKECSVCYAGSTLFENQCISPTSCVSPLYTTSYNDFCKSPCPTSDFIYWNTSCLSTCDFPLQQATLLDPVKQCIYPCQMYEFLYYNGSCMSECAHPFTLRIEAGKNYCDRFCPNNFKDIYDSVYMGCLELPEYSSISRILHHMKYLNLEKAPKLHRLKVIRGNNIISLRVIPDSFDEARNKFLQISFLSFIPSAIVPTRFIANFLDDLILLAIIIFCGIIFFIAKSVAVANGAPSVGIWFDKLMVLTLWNLPLVLIATNWTDIILFAIIEFRGFDPRYINFEVIISLVIAILMFTIAVSFIIFTIYLCVRAHQAQKQSFEAYKAFFNKWRSCNVLFEGYREDTIFDRLFLVIYCFRMFLVMLLTLSLSWLPFIQAIINILLSGAFITFLILRRPIKKVISLINLIFIEIFLLIANITILILATYDSGEEDVDNRDKLITMADTILYINFALDIQAGVFLLLKVGYVIRDVFEYKQKGYVKREIFVLLSLIYLPLQQGFFGFEEVVLGEPVNTSRKVKQVQPSPKSKRSSPMRDVNTSNQGLISTQVIHPQGVSDLESSMHLGNMSYMSPIQSSFQTPSSQAPKMKAKKKKKKILKPLDKAKAVERLKELEYGISSPNNREILTRKNIDFVVRTSSEIHERPIVRRKTIRNSSPSNMSQVLSSNFRSPKDLRRSQPEEYVKEDIHENIRQRYLGYQDYQKYKDQEYPSYEDNQSSNQRRSSDFYQKHVYRGEENR